MRIARHLAVMATALSLSLAPAAVLAHTELTASDPADGAVLTEAPTEVVLTFSGEVGEDASFTVADAGGAPVGEGSVDLGVADRNVLRGDVTITEPGEYTVTYSVTAEDGHPTGGEVTFTVDPEGGEEWTPDTAVPASPMPAPTLAGLVLVLMSTVLAARRLATDRA